MIRGRKAIWTSRRCSSLVIANWACSIVSLATIRCGFGGGEAAPEKHFFVLRCERKALATQHKRKLSWKDCVPPNLPKVQLLNNPAAAAAPSPLRARRSHSQAVWL